MSRTILFLCPHNAAKSVLAVAHCKRLVERFGLDLKVDSAGTEPDAAVMPSVAALLHDENIDVAQQVPRHVTRAQLEGAWRIVSFGCEGADLSAAAVPVEEWLDVPQASEDANACWRAIQSRVDALVEAIRRGEAATED